MANHSCLPIWLLIFGIYSPCSVGISKTVQTNPLYKQEDNNTKNQYPDRDVFHVNSVVSKKTNRQSEFGESLNYNQDALLRKDPDSSSEHKVIKREKKPYLVFPKFEDKLKRYWLNVAVQNAILAVNAQNERWEEMLGLWEDVRNDNEMIREQDEQNIVAEVQAILDEGGTEEMARAHRLQRLLWWDTWGENRDAFYERMVRQVTDELERLQHRRDDAQQDLEEFNELVPMFPHDGEL